MSYQKKKMKMHYKLLCKYFNGRFYDLDFKQLDARFVNLNFCTMDDIDGSLIH